MVPVDAVGLKRLASRELPPPSAPDIGGRTTAVFNGLDDRFARVPFGRVRRWADYWALRDVEFDALESYWLIRIQAHLSNTLERLRTGNRGAMHRSRIAGRLGSGPLFQVWSNTVGPGARTLGRESLRRHPPPHLPAPMASIDP